MLLVSGEREDAITRLTDSYVAIWITLRSILLIILLIVTVMSHILRFFPVVVILYIYHSHLQRQRFLSSFLHYF